MQRNCRGTAVPSIRTPSVSTGSWLCGPAGGSLSHMAFQALSTHWQSPETEACFPCFLRCQDCGELAFGFPLRHDLFSSPIPIVPGGSAAEEWQTLIRDSRTKLGSQRPSKAVQLQPSRWTFFFFFFDKGTYPSLLFVSWRETTPADDSSLRWRRNAL